MGQLTLAAQLVAAPAQQTDQNFPSGSTTIPFSTTPAQKPYNVDSGRNNYNIASPGAYVALQPLGPSGQVTQAHTLYIRTSVPVLLRLSFGATVLADIPVQGTFFMEFPAGSPLTLCEIKGTGAVEYYVAGVQ